MSANKFAKFYFTDYGNRDFNTFPLLLKTSEKHIRILLKNIDEIFPNFTLENSEDFHELLFKYSEFETTFLFLQEDSNKTLLNIMVYGKKNGHAYKECLRIIVYLKKTLSSFIIKDFINN